MFFFQGWTWPKMGSLLFPIVFIAIQFATGWANPEAKRLYDDLLSNYNRLIRPVGNNSDRLTVKMGLRLSQLIDVVSILMCVCVCIDSSIHPRFILPWRTYILVFLLRLTTLCDDARTRKGYNMLLLLLRTHTSCVFDDKFSFQRH